MDTKVYIKKRKDFGTQPLFCIVPSQMLDSIEPDKFEQRRYGLRNPVHQFSQASVLQSEHYINTKRVLYQDQGINHAEGGWPKDILYNDEEQTARVRRREERDDDYINAIMNTYPKFQHTMKQNNAIELYQMYYKEIPPVKPVEKSSLRMNNAYYDPNKRPVSCLAWTLEDDTKLVASYCNKKFPVVGPLNKVLTCYVWDLENPSKPVFEFEPPKACWQVACSSLFSNVLVGGLEDGTVCLFDMRVKKEPVNVSPIHFAHRDPVSSLLYIQYRSNTEFFTGSTDGRCLWWDVRNISIPTDSLIMSVRIPPGEQTSLANSEGVSSLQFEKMIPTRFLCGTDTGLVINVNRKGKTFNETMTAVYNAHNGPVKALHRSPCTTKMFITCGDWTVHIWSDDVLTSPIITGIPNRKQISDVAWAPRRISCYMTISDDGNFRYWDLLRKTREPVIKLFITKSPLKKIKPHEDGRLIAIGDGNGVLYVLSVSDNLMESADVDKVLMLQTYDRETRREHILENRVKEIRLKLKAEEEQPPQNDGDIIDEEANIKAAEDEFKRVVMEAMYKSNVASKGIQIRER